MSSTNSSWDTRIGGFSLESDSGSGGVSCLGGISFMEKDSFAEGGRRLKFAGNMSWRLQPTGCALLVIDVQERIAAVMTRSEAMIKRVVDTVKVARLFGIPVFHTEQAPNKLGPTVAPIMAALGMDAAPARSRLDISKAGCFGPDELPGTLLVVGIETHACIRQTAFDLRERGHVVYVLADAVSSRAETDHRLALHELREIAGARITTLEAVAWELLGRAEGDTFKKLVAILK